MDEAAKEELTDELPETARHTSERERRADDAERELVQWKKVRFMADKVGDEFDGYVTGVSAFGLYIELVEHFVEGMVHVSTMADDYYRFVESAHLLRGENTHKVYRLGDRVRVQVVRVDMERRQIELALEDVLRKVRSASAKASARSLRDQRLCWLASRSFSEGWWRGLDSNQRTLARADLQSAAFNHSATSPGVGRRAIWRARAGVSTGVGATPLAVLARSK